MVPLCPAAHPNPSTIHPGHSSAACKGLPGVRVLLQQELLLCAQHCSAVSHEPGVVFFPAALTGTMARMCMARQSDLTAALDPLLDPTHLEGQSLGAGFCGTKPWPGSGEGHTRALEVMGTAAGRHCASNVVHPGRGAWQKAGKDTQVFGTGRDFPLLSDLPWPELCEMPQSGGDGEGLGGCWGSASSLAKHS